MPGGEAQSYLSEMADRETACPVLLVLFKDKAVSRILMERLHALSVFQSPSSLTPAPPQLFSMPVFAFSPFEMCPSVKPSSFRLCRCGGVNT